MDDPPHEGYSDRFHGKFPGKMKQEKRLKKFEEEMKLRHCDQADTPLNTMKARYAAQRERRPSSLCQPFLYAPHRPSPVPRPQPRTRPRQAAHSTLTRGIHKRASARLAAAFTGIERRGTPLCVRRAVSDSGGSCL